MVSLEKYDGSCNAIGDHSSWICVVNIREDINLKIIKMTITANKSKTLRKHTSCNCRWKFDVTKCNSNQKWNNYKYKCNCKKPIKIMLSVAMYVDKECDKDCEIEEYLKNYTSKWLMI